MSLDELDVRQIRKPDKHPAIFAAYGELGVGDSFVLVNNHDPRHLRDEFELDHPRGYGWEYLAKGPKEWRIRISKLAATPLPRVLGEIGAVIDGSDEAGAIWKLQMRERDLDSNVIRLAPDSGIDAHAGPDLDVLLVVLAGSGQLATDVDEVDLANGALAWLPRGSRRQITAGPDGLCYLTVHRRRQALQLAPFSP